MFFCHKDRYHWFPAQHLLIEYSKNPVCALFLIPPLFTVAIVNFGGAWNDYVWPLVSASETHMRTLQVGMSLQLGNRLGMYMGTSLAGIIISTMPTIFLLVYFQKYLLRGFAIGTK